MTNILRKAAMASLILGCLLAARGASAAGFEKATFWGAREAGVAGIGSPYIQGSDALYFNPAGLVADKTGFTTALNVSITAEQFQGPINDANDEAFSNMAIATPAAFTFGWTPTERWGFGIGYYVAAGAKADYDSVSFADSSSTLPFNLHEKNELTVSELALGAGYKVTDRLKIGAAYRLVFASATLAAIQRIQGLGVEAVANVDLNNLSDTEYTGFRLGAQYKLDDSTNLSVVYRSEVNVSASGDLSGNIYANTGTPTAVPVAHSSATANTTLPMSATLGIEHRFSSAWDFLAEYVWTQYSRVNRITIDGTIAGQGLSTHQGATLQENWHDEHQVRLGSEYTGFKWPIRFGYVWTSQVTDSNYPYAVFVPPGMAHTFTVGSGKTWAIWDRPLTFDFAADYTMAQGTDNSGAPAQDTLKDNRAGFYAVNAYTVHLGVGYAF